MHPMLNIAVKAARRAGNLIHRSADKIDHLTITKKSHADFVSEVDRAAEQTIIQTLLDAYPDHAILAEESGAQGESEYLWIIDPLDGTTNFLHGFPQFAVSIALQHKGIITQAVVYDPTKNELFTATRGRGAFLNDKRLRVTKRLHLADSLIGTGFPYTRFEHLDAYIAHLQRPDAKDRRPAPPRLRRAGSGVDGGRTLRRILRDRPQTLGHRRRHAADHRSGRHGQRPAAATTPISRPDTCARATPTSTRCCCR